MNAGPHSSLDTLQQAVQDAATSWLELDARERAHHQALAERPGGDDARWRTLQAVHQERTALEGRLGRALGRWLARGGSVELVDPDDPDVTGSDATSFPEGLPEDDRIGTAAPAAPSSAPEAPAVGTAEGPPTAPSPAPDPHPPAPSSEGPASPHAETSPPSQSTKAPSAESSPTRPARTAEASPTPPARSAEASPAQPPAPATPPAPKPPAVPKGPPASADSLRALQERGVGSAAPSPRPARALHHGRALADRLLGLCERPLDREALDGLASAMHTLQALTGLPSRRRAEVLRVVVARLRGAYARGVSRERADRLRIAVETHRQAHPWGKVFVNGLRADHGPERKTWDDDADAAWETAQGAPPAPATEDAPCPKQLLDDLERDLPRLTDPSALRAAVVAVLDAGVDSRHTRLLNLLQGREKDLKGDGRLKNVRRGLRDRRQDDRPAPPPKDRPPEDWPHWSRVRGKVAVMVGGDPRPHNRELLKRTFELERLEWPEHDARTLERIRQGLASGRYDLLIINRFGGHDVDDTVLAEVRSDLSRWIRVDTGYGAQRIRQAMEQQWRGFLTPDG